MNTDLYLIMQLLSRVVPDDISNKILLILLGMVKTHSARCMKVPCRNKMRFEMGGWQYEIRPQQTNVQQMVMCEIRIEQFNANHEYNQINSRRIKNGAITNIKQYLKILDNHFKRRFKFLFC
jgi:hypothetical protein